MGQARGPGRSRQKDLGEQMYGGKKWHLSSQLQAVCVAGVHSTKWSGER